MNIISTCNCNLCQHGDVCKHKEQFRELDKELNRVISEEVCSTNRNLWFVLEEKCTFYKKIGE